MLLRHIAQQLISLGQSLLKACELPHHASEIFDDFYPASMLHTVPFTRSEQLSQEEEALCEFSPHGIREVN